MTRLIAAVAAALTLALPASAVAATTYRTQRAQLIRVTSGDTFEAVVRHSYQRIRAYGFTAPDTRSARHTLRAFLHPGRHKRITLRVYGRCSTGELLADAVRSDRPWPAASLGMWMIVTGLGAPVPISSQW